jgi:hypothetical protein
MLSSCRHEIHQSSPFYNFITVLSSTPPVFPARCETLLQKLQRGKNQFACGTYKLFKMPKIVWDK